MDEEKIEIEIKELGHMLEKKHAMYLEGRSFSVTSELNKDVLKVNVVFSNDDKSFYYPIQTRMNVKAEEMAVKDAAMLLVDYVDLYLDDYFEEAEALNIPIDWSDFEYDAVKFQMKGQVINRLVEAQADMLLDGELPVVE